MVELNEKKLDEKLKVFLKDVEEITHRENEVYGDKDLAEINDLDDENSKDVKKN